MTELLTFLNPQTTLFGLHFLDLPALIEMLTRFILNITAVGIVIHFFYYPKSQRRDYYFTFILMAVSIFMLIYLMDDAKMKVGAALGLFAVFGIIRYRTEQIAIRDMTYLFFIVALSVVNGMSVKLSAVELLVSNGIFILTAAFAENHLLVKRISYKYIRYDNIDLINAARNEELIADLEKRTGLHITRVEIGSIDFLRDCTLLKIHYTETDKKHSNSVDTITKLPKEYE